MSENWNSIYICVHAIVQLSNDSFQLSYNEIKTCHYTGSIALPPEMLPSHIGLNNTLNISSHIFTYKENDNTKLYPK